MQIFALFNLLLKSAKSVSTISAFEPITSQKKTVLIGDFIQASISNEYDEIAPIVVVPVFLFYLILLRLVHL